MELKQIVKHLKNYGNLSNLSKILSISRPTLINIRDIKSYTPNYKTYKILSDYFVKLDGLHAKVKNNVK